MDFLLFSLHCQNSLHILQKWNSEVLHDTCSTSPPYVKKPAKGVQTTYIRVYYPSTQAMPRFKASIFNGTSFAFLPVNIS